MPNAAMDSWVATNFPRFAAFDVSETHVGTVPVFMPFPVPWMSRISGVLLQVSMNIQIRFGQR